VFVPTVCPRVEEQYNFRCVSIKRSKIRPFACIAAETSPGQILRLIGAAMFKSNDVIDVMRIKTHTFRLAAVLTACSSAPDYAGR
jgi:hypothetical protein